jgi:serine/threonine-protein kinase
MLAVTEADPLIGRTINDRFRLTSLIARGGMGRVYRAEQALLGRICAVKVLDPASVGGADAALDRRFLLEATVTSRLNHPNIVTVFECGRTSDNIHYMAMEYLAGRTLGRAIRASGRLSEDRTMHIARQTCRALREAHAAGVVHRDLKPTNVFLLDRDDEVDFVKVLDFGLVTQVASERREELTEKNLLLGSPRYMAPEQIRGERVDARADVYALGIVLYEMMTGRVPFEGPGNAKILTSHLNEPAPPMRLTHGVSPSPPMERLILRCIEKNADRRFRSMVEVLAALDALTAPVGSVGRLGSWPEVRRARCDDSAGEDGPPTTATRPTPGGPPGVRKEAAVCSAVLGLVGVLIGWGSHGARAPCPRAPPMASAASQSAASANEPVEVRNDSPPADGTATILVTTDPSASTVKEGEIELCHATPCAIVYEGVEAQRAASHELTLAHDGYRSETRTVRGGDDTVAVALTPIASSFRRRVPPRDRDVVRLAGYKLDVPY